MLSLYTYKCDCINQNNELINIIKDLIIEWITGGVGIKVMFIQPYQLYKIATKSDLLSTKNVIYTILW